MSFRFIWRRDPLAFAGHVEGVAKKRTLEVAKAVYDGIVARTPVRTGSARASWRASLNAPDTSRVIHKSSESPLAPPTFPIREMPLYGKVYISNSTPYITALEFGWSQQAPAGMVRVTLASLGVGLRRV